MMDSIVSAYRQAYHDWFDQKITREEFWKRVKELDAKQPKLFGEEASYENNTSPVLR